jgi:hypothetical protein
MVTFVGRIEVGTAGRSSATGEALLVAVQPNWQGEFCGAPKELHHASQEGQKNRNTPPDTRVWRGVPLIKPCIV